MSTSSVSCRYSTRIKICGITSIDDAVGVANAGADAIGLVFYSASPRNVNVEQAALIARAVGPLVSTVGLFVNAEAEYINSVLARVPLQVLQFHGDETPAFCEQFSRPYIKALRMKDGLDAAEAIANYPSASGILLDAYRQGVPGGTGETFDWQRVPKYTGRSQLSRPIIILAGGLTPANVQTAIQQALPYGVDVSGGLESSPGNKDIQKVVNFIQNVKACCQP